MRVSAAAAGAIVLAMLAGFRAAAPADEPPPPAGASEEQLAGLPEDAPAQTLSLEQAYHLSLIIAREAAAGRQPDPDAQLEPARRVELVRRHAVHDWGRFRDDFLAGRLRDPAAPFFEALGRRHALLAAERAVSAEDSLLQAYREVTVGAGPT